jgi:hypothetical protein
VFVWLKTRYPGTYHSIDHVVVIALHAALIYFVYNGNKYNTNKITCNKKLSPLFPIQ